MECEKLKAACFFAISCEMLLQWETSELCSEKLLALLSPKPVLSSSTLGKFVFRLPLAWKPFESRTLFFLSLQLDPDLSTPPYETLHTHLTEQL